MECIKKFFNEIKIFNENGPNFFKRIAWLMRGKLFAPGECISRSGEQVDISLLAYGAIHYLVDLAFVYEDSSDLFAHSEEARYFISGYQILLKHVCILGTM